jgi:hypothetical protein
MLDKLCCAVNNIYVLQILLLCLYFSNSLKISIFNSLSFIPYRKGVTSCLFPCVKFLVTDQRPRQKSISEGGRLIVFVTLIEMERRAQICQIEKWIYEIQERADAKWKGKHQFALSAASG